MSNVSLKIFGHKEDPTTPNATSGKKFEAGINPEKIIHSRKLSFNTENTANSTAKDVRQYQGYEQDELHLELILDEAIVNENETRNVETQVKELKGVVYDYEGAIHKPNYLTVNWGNFGFKGHLQSMKIEYGLFDPSGKPIRATVNISLVGHEDFEAAQRSANNQSPDMSHVNLIRDSDALPLMCNEIYDDMKYYVQIAELNELTNFRNLKIGDRLLFPPLEL
ncbi:MAG: hypothetical protein ACI85O_002756 [Saprospiraceae bacterium]|jgi:hypothetical protein